MKKLFNSADTMVDDMLDGFVSAFPQVQHGSSDPRVIKRATNAKNPDEKVTLLIGNGSGHEPIAMGFVGQGVLDCLLYTSPSPRDRTRSRMPSSA